jgi:hypothetical protein
MATDPAGDFLDVYTGPENGDLDVITFDALLTGADEVTLVGTHAAPIGTTEGAAYVWGIDRGAGTEPFPTLDPPTGEGVTFDAVVSLLPDGTGVLIDLAAGTPPQPLDPSSIGVSGPTITVTLPASLLPSQGRDFADYTYNLWPRFAPGGVDPTDNTQVSDFAPDASTFPARPQEPSEPPPEEPPPEQPPPTGAVDWDALAAVVVANFEATGHWFPGQEDLLPPPPIDWDAVAAEATANFEATGQWFL